MKINSLLHRLIAKFFSFCKTVRQNLLLPRFLIKYISFLILSVMFCLVAPPLMAHNSPLIASNSQHNSVSVNLLQSGQQYYEAGEFAQAARSWEKAAKTYEKKGDTLNQAKALSNLALAHQQMGQLGEANQIIDSALSLIAQTPSSTKRQQVMAQALNTQAGLLISQGELDKALAVLQTSSTNYQQTQDEVGQIRSQLNIVRVLQLQGKMQKAIETLNPLAQNLSEQPNSALKAVALRQVGENFRLVGNLESARKTLEQSLQIAESLELNNETTSTLIALGDLARAEFQTEIALDFYGRAANNAVSPATKIQALVHQFSLMVSSKRLAEAQSLRSQIQTAFSEMPAGRELVYGRINFADSLSELENLERENGVYTANADNWNSQETPRRRNANINDNLTFNSLPDDDEFKAQLNSSPRLFDLERVKAKLDNLITSGNLDPDQKPSARVVQSINNAAKQAHSLGDIRAESYALGTLGHLYEEAEQWDKAQQNTQEALLLAQAIGASDITYQWQWQLGRSLKAQGQSDRAIIAYREAYKNLQLIRSSMATVDSEAQFSFREEVEPVYREYAELLLEKPDEVEIEQAREVIESLQVAELTNFFRADCDVDKEKIATIEEIDPEAAVIYPIILPNRLEVVLSIPNQPIRHYAVSVDSATLEDAALEFRYQLDIPDSDDYLASAQQLYDWLVRPLEEDLEQSGAKTLAFVLDGALRNIPVAALHDGEQYLIQKHAIALTPGLQLVNPQPLANKSLKALVGAISEAVKVDEVEYKALPAVEEEVQSIKTELPKSDVLKNQTFTNSNFAAQIKKLSFPVVHLATHGQFGSTAEDTYILTYDDPINVNQLSDLLRSSSQAQEDAIELLIFSACETASGDERAALGLAGVAVRSGARSTIATLWQVNDSSTSKFMDGLYNQLGQLTTTKAEALRRSQLALLDKQEFQHPYYWAPFVLVGNWL